VEPAKAHNSARTRRHLARRGLTFIETVCAVALLALITSMVFGGFESIYAQQLRQKHRLGAAELANRLVLQYLDDKNSLPSASLPLEYEGVRYRWTMREVPVRMVHARPEVAAERAGASALTPDRLKAVTIRVWLSEESGGSFVDDGVSPAFAVTRLMDPIAAATRNPDSSNNMFTNAQLQRQFLEEISRIGRNRAAPRTQPPARGGTPPPPSPTRPGVSPKRSGRKVESS
jgi:hypothetical protein